MADIHHLMCHSYNQSIHLTKTTQSFAELYQQTV